MPKRKPVNHRLTDEQLSVLRAMIPEGCFFMLLIASLDATGIDTDIPPAKQVCFLSETARNLTEKQASSE